MSSETLLDWFNEQLLFNGQDMWEITEKRWSYVKEKLDFYVIQWTKCKSPTVVSKMPPSLCNVKRKLF